MQRMPRLRSSSSSAQPAPMRAGEIREERVGIAQGPRCEAREPLVGDDRLHGAPRQLGEQRLADARRVRGTALARSGRRRGIGSWLSTCATKTISPPSKMAMFAVSPRGLHEIA